MFAAWHPVHGFGPVDEIALRGQYDHAKTDVRLLSHTGDKQWQVVEVEIRPVGPKPTKGGPTEQHPDAPYCKPDQSCCDFCCGN
jgi:hypothetical protein